MAGFFADGAGMGGDQAREAEQIFSLMVLVLREAADRSHKFAAILEDLGWRSARPEPWKARRALFCSHARLFS